jgi:hypothetical protein
MLWGGQRIRQVFVQRERKALGRSEVAAGLCVTCAILWGGQRLRQAFVQRVQCFGAVRGCGRPSCNACNALRQSEGSAGLRATRAMLWGGKRLRQAFVQRVQFFGAVRGLGSLRAARGMLWVGPMIRQAFVKRLGAFTGCGRPSCNACNSLGRSEVAAGLCATRACCGGYDA